MKKSIFYFLSILPSFVFGRDVQPPVSTIRVSAPDQSTILNVIPVLQTATTNMGLHKLRFAFNFNSNSAEFKIRKSSSSLAPTDVIVQNLQSILGSNVRVEMVSYDLMHLGTQDDHMEP